MPRIRTTLFEIARVEVKAVNYMEAHPLDDGTRYMMATQTVTFTFQDGTVYEVGLHLQDGNKSLAIGETVVMPPLSEVAGEPA